MEDNPDDLARYVLDTPQTLLVRDDGGQTRLLIGGEEDGRTYVMRDGIPAVLSVKTRALAFMELDYAQVMDRLVWLYSIDQAQSLTVERQGRTDVLEVRGGTGFWFNGARDVYKRQPQHTADRRHRHAAGGHGTSYVCLCAGASQGALQPAAFLPDVFYHYYGYLQGGLLYSDLYLVWP